MNQQELRDMLWQELPLVRRTLVGRERVDDLISIAIEQCPLEYVGCVSSGSVEHDVVVAAWGTCVRRSFQLLYGDDVQFGPLFWILISPMLQYLLKRLLEWWFEAPANRVLLAGWRKDMTR